MKEFDKKCYSSVYFECHKIKQNLLVERLTEYAYDLSGRLTSEAVLKTTGRFEQAKRKFSGGMYCYDANGNRVLKMSNVGEMTALVASSYDKNNRLISEKKATEPILCLPTTATGTS